MSAIIAEIPPFEGMFDRMKAAPNREVEFAPGPNRPTIDWRAAMQSTEQWLPVVGYEGLYEVSDHGGLRSVDRIVARASSVLPVKGHVFSLVPRYDGRIQAQLSRNNLKKTFMVHRLVLLAFAGAPEEGQEACHDNGIDSDNRFENLRWDTHAANEADKLRHGTWFLNRSHCPHGHEYTEENTYLSSGKYKTCRTCTKGRNVKTKRSI